MNDTTVKVDCYRKHLALLATIVGIMLALNSVLYALTVSTKDDVEQRLRSLERIVATSEERQVYIQRELTEIKRLIRERNP